MIIDAGKFEHLLNCLANQKFIYEQNKETQEEWQAIIDKAWDEGMKTLSMHRHAKTLCNWPQASESNEQPSDSGSRPSELSAYGNDCPSGNCEV